MKDVAEHACKFPARKIDGEVFVGECKICGASVAAASLALEAERDDLMARVKGLEAMIPNMPCCPDGFMDEPCSSFIEEPDRVRELETETDERGVLALRLWEILSPMLGKADRDLFGKDVDAVLGSKKLREGREHEVSRD